MALSAASSSRTGPSALGDFLTGVPALRALAPGLPGAPPRARRARRAGAAGRAHRRRRRGRRHRRRSARAPRGADIAVNLHGRGPQTHAVLRAARPGRLIAFGGDGVRVARRRARGRAAGAGCSRSHGVPADPDDLDLPAPRVPAPVAPGATVIHPGAASAARRWPAERWAAVARAQTAAGRAVVVTGGSGERDLADARRLRAAGSHGAGRADGPARRWPRPWRAPGGSLCGDTGVAHLATAFGTPSVVLFGPTSAHRVGSAGRPPASPRAVGGPPRRPARPGAGPRPARDQRRGRPRGVLARAAVRSDLEPHVGGALGHAPARGDLVDEV